MSGVRAQLLVLGTRSSKTRDKVKACINHKPQTTKAKRQEPETHGNPSKRTVKTDNSTHEPMQTQSSLRLRRSLRISTQTPTPPPKERPHSPPCSTLLHPPIPSHPHLNRFSPPVFLIPSPPRYSQPGKHSPHYPPRYTSTDVPPTNQILQPSYALDFELGDVACR